MRRKFVLGGLVLALATTALALAGGSAARSEQDPFKVAFIYPGPHNDGGWSQSHDRGRLAIEKALGNKVETTYKENIFSNAQVPQVVAGLVREGYDMIFGCSFGMFENGVNGQLYSRYPDVLFEQATGLQIKKNQSEYFGAGEDTIYLSGMAAGAASKKGLIGYIVPFPIPGPLMRSAWTAVLASEGDGGREEPDRSRCGRARAERRQPGGGRRRGGEEGPLGRLRLRRAQVGADAVADGGDVQLGPVLREACQGGHQRNLEVRVLLRDDQGRIHQPRAVRPEGHGEDEGGDRRETEGHRRGQVQRLHRPHPRSEGQDRGAGRKDAQDPPGSLLDAVAREGRHREGLDGRASGLVRRSDPAAERPASGNLRERNPHSRIPFCA